MFGTYRFMLALMVMASHLWPDIGKTAGPQAVYGFFVLSGYLMTKVVNQCYADGLPGLVRYLANRSLRIFPAYWIAVAAAALLAATTSVTLQTFALPSTPQETIAQIVIFGLVTSDSRLVPPAWSLDVELVYYVLIGVLFARSRALTLSWLVLGATAAAYLTATITDAWIPPLWYYAAPSVAFAFGAVLAHRPMTTMVLRPRWAILAVAPIPLFAAADSLLLNLPMVAGWYATCALAVAATACLARISGASWRVVIVDRWLGDLAYPMFLWHFNAMVLIYCINGGWPAQPLLFAAGLALTLFASIMSVLLLDRPLELIRGKLRAGMHHPVHAIIQ